MKHSTPTAVITGASSGIGLELARLLAADGYRLVIVGREAGKLAETATNLRAEFTVPVEPLVADLSTDAGTAKVLACLEKGATPIDVLINNAGVGLVGEFAQLSADTQLKMIHLNVTSLTALTHAVLPGMLKRRRGRILNVASTAAFQPGPLMAVYYATKAHVLSFSEALWEETRGSGVSVTALCPGPTRTGFQDRAQAGNTFLFRRNLMDAATVARVGYQAMQRGQRTVVPGLANWFGTRIVGLLPRASVLRGIRRLHQT